MGLGIKIPKNAFTIGKQKFAEGGDFQNVELAPGRYTCILKGGRAVDTKDGPQVVLDLEVAGEAEQAGGKIGVFFSLAEERIVWLFRVLTVLGYDVSELDEDTLEAILNEIKTTTPVVRVSAKTTGVYTNYRIDKLLPELTAADVAKGKGESGAENAADEDAGGGKAGVKETAHAKAKGKAKAKHPEPVEGMEEEEEADEPAPPPSKAKAPVKKAAPPEPEPEPEPVEEEEEEEAVDEEEVELKVGMVVKATIKGVKHDATVQEICDDDKVLILSKTDKKKYRIGLDKLEI